MPENNGLTVSTKSETNNDVDLAGPSEHQRLSLTDTALQEVAKMTMSCLLKI